MEIFIPSRPFGIYHAFCWNELIFRKFSKIKIFGYKIHAIRVMKVKKTNFNVNIQLLLQVCAWEKASFLKRCYVQEHFPKTDESFKTTLNFGANLFGVCLRFFRKLQFWRVRLSTWDLILNVNLLAIIKLINILKIINEQMNKMFLIFVKWELNTVRFGMQIFLTRWNLQFDKVAMQIDWNKLLI